MSTVIQYARKSAEDNYFFPKGRFESFAQKRESPHFPGKRVYILQGLGGKHNCLFPLPASVFSSLMGELMNTGGAASYCGHSFLAEVRTFNLAFLGLF